MAPRRGGISITIGSSSSCEQCLEPLTLEGWQWKYVRMDVLFAFEIIALLVLIICLFLVPRFKWVRAAGQDKLRRSGYVLAVFWAIVFFALDATNIAMSEDNVTTTRLFYLTSIFANLGWRLADILILGILQRTICESSTTPLARRLPKPHRITMCLLVLLSITSFGIYIFQIQDLIAGSGYYFYSYGYVAVAKASIDLVYNVVYFVAVLELSVVAAIVFLQERARGTLLMASIVMPSLFLRSLLPVISTAISVASINGHDTSFEIATNVGWANSFIYTMTVPGVFLGVAIIGMWAPAGEALRGKNIGYEQPGVARV